MDRDPESRTGWWIKALVLTGAMAMFCACIWADLCDSLGWEIVTAVLFVALYLVMVAIDQP